MEIFWHLQAYHSKHSCNFDEKTKNSRRTLDIRVSLGRKSLAKFSVFCRQPNRERHFTQLVLHVCAQTDSLLIFIPYERHHIDMKNFEKSRSSFFWRNLLKKMDVGTKNFYHSINSL